MMMLELVQWRFLKQTRADNQPWHVTIIQYSIGYSVVEPSQTLADNQPWHAKIIQLFIGCSVVEVSQTRI